MFPSLQSTIGTLVSCLEVIQAAANCHQDYNDLASNLRDLAVLLEKHLRESASTSMSDCASNVLRSIEKEVEFINKRRERSLVKGLVRASEDAEEVIRSYRRIESHFRQLQGSMRYIYIH